MLKKKKQDSQGEILDELRLHRELLCKELRENPKKVNAHACKLIKKLGIKYGSPSTREFIQDKVNKLNKAI